MSNREVNDIYKDAKLPFSVTAKVPPNSRQLIRFSTQDKGSARLVFEMKDKHNKPYNLTGVTGEVTLIMEDGSRFVDNAIILNVTNGEVEYILTDEQIRHAGKGKGELSLKLPGQSTIAGFRFEFIIEKALKDKDLEPVEEYYFSDFEVIKEKLEGLEAGVDGLTVTQVNNAKKDTQGVVHENLDSRVKAEVGRIETKQREFATQLTDIAISVKSFGAKGDGVSNDTTAIQNALNTGRKVIIPKGKYMINAVTGLKPLNNQTIEFEDGAEFKAIPNSAPAYALISIENKKNISILNGKITGERFEHMGTSGEWGACIRLMASDNITIRNCIMSESWGDGIYIGASDIATQTECENISIYNSICTDNRRLGMAITAARNVNVYDSVFKNTGGFSPESGVDIEPNLNFYCDGIHFFNCVMTDNNTSGFIASIVSKGIVQNVSLFECEMSNNKFDGAELIGAINTRFTNCKFTKNRNGVNAYIGSVNTQITNCLVKESSVMGVRSYDSNNTIIENSIITESLDNGIFFKGLNNKATRNTVSKSQKVGILVDAGSEETEITNNDVLDNTQAGIYVTSDKTRITRNLIRGNGLNGTSSNIEIYSRNSIIKHNDVKLGNGSAVYGIRMTSGQNNTVLYNDFTDAGVTGSTQILTQTNSKFHSNFDALKSGTTSQRPSVSEVGFDYYDTTLGKVIYWNGSAWRDVNSVSPENRGINLTVGGGLTSLIVTFVNPESNAFYVVNVSPQWNTSFWITNKTTLGFTINFSMPPSTTSALDWSIRR